MASLLLLLPATRSVGEQNPIRSYADGIEKRFDPRDPHVSYTVTLPKADSVAWLVQMHIGNVRDSLVTLQLPNWSPGIYQLTNAWRGIRDVAARDSSGAELRTTRPDSSTWIVRVGEARAFTVSYRLKPLGAIRGTSRHEFLHSSTELLDGPSTFMHIRGAQHLPAHVRFILPAGWRVGTGLMATPDSMVYFASSYDILIDSPTLLGSFQRWVFSAGGVPHQVLVANDGERVRFDTLAFVDVVRRVTQATIGLFGQAPYKDYTFIYIPGSGGGLEHLNSATMGIDTAAIRIDVRRAAGVTAHELFHAWNVKRIRPAALGPFDYAREQRTSDLWFSEGVTSYYGALIMIRAGVYTPELLRQAVRGNLQAVLNDPCRSLRSPEQASWMTWDPLTATGGCRLSYYVTGSLRGLLLDIAIRDSTGNRRSLDDVLRYLFEHRSGEQGFTSADLVLAVNRVSGRDFSKFFQDYVSGRADIPWNEYFGRVGWRLSVRDSIVAVDQRLFFAPPNVKLPTILEGTSPYPRAVVFPGMAIFSTGTLRTGDEIVRVAGGDARGDAVLQRLRDIRPGQVLTLDILRGGRPATVRYVGVPYTLGVPQVLDEPQPSPRAQQLLNGIISGLTERE